ncbi:N-acetyltransferase [Salinibacterium sp. UTAS2018]|uniref:GNAT family N-acetyltransferase n=1 Tax=Salinibacterium sp. UTAS2018 TaxID=2508880 RepID=UPI0010096937|nr:GNAT family N-acetyltransferase [Salinibacterium sp. UTAS2018]QAV71338.1 N-acetyltransferase [Salinibacterium sp. UTAS2018]
MNAVSLRSYDRGRSTTYRVDAPLGRDAIINLYAAVQWTAYTLDPDRLMAAIAASLRVVTAWDGIQLVGLARVVGDGLTIVYLQDILVVPEYHRSGIGRELFLRVFQPFGDVRQKLLVTDDEPGQIAFYRAMGFTEVRNLEHRTSVFTKFA